MPPNIRAAASPAMFKETTENAFLTQHFPPVSFSPQTYMTM